MKREPLLAAWCGVAFALSVACTPQVSSSGGSSTGAPDQDAGAVEGLDAGACETCLAAKCPAEQRACDSDCLAVQACIDAVCANLSVTSSPDEGACQVSCQGMHPNGVAAQLALADCAATESPVADAGPSCLPPCLGAPLDFQACVAAQTAGPCAKEASACAGDPSCVAFRSCAAACTDLADCQACGASTAGGTGLAAYETLLACVDRRCAALEWLPHF